MSRHVIVGAGPVGTATALLLAERGEAVRVITRRGTGPGHPAVERVAADAADAEALTRLAGGAVALYNCAAPPYHRWETDWPPLAAAFLATAAATGAVLVIAANAYGYGPVIGAMTEDTRLRARGVKGRVRAQMWREAASAHRAGRLRAAEVRASDHLGAGSRSPLTRLVLPRVLAGRRTSVPADLDAPHSWTYVGDVARTLVAVADDERTWGRPWHVPTAPPVSIRELAVLACQLAGARPPRLSVMPEALLRLGGLGSPLVRELRETQYQFRRPFVLDSTFTARTLGIDPVPVEDALRETVQGLTRQPV